MPRPMLRCSILTGLLLLAPGPCFGGGAEPDSAELARLSAVPRSEMVAVIRRYQADEGALSRAYRADASPARAERLARLYDGWLSALDGMAFEAMSLDGKVDWVLLRNTVERDRHGLKISADHLAEVGPYTPFAGTVVELAEARRTLVPLLPAQSAARLDELKKQIEAAKKDFEEKLKPAEGGGPGVTPATSKRLLDVLEGLRGDLSDWYGFWDGYDPVFTWWNAEPYRAADQALDGYIRVVRERGAGITPDNPDAIVGSPIGREALLADLKFEMIPYSPEELIAIADREMAWCEAELLKAAAEMGCGDDWKQALERVKQTHLEPGEQPRLIRDLANEAVAFLKERDLITVPPLAEEVWRMDMMSPQRQLVTPFFTGGEVISVAFPAASMAHEQKMMSLRGNNVHFARATVFHELIPGHHLQQFVCARNKTHRAPFSTPFWTEGWALYWEMLMWDQGFQKSPQNRIGMLFWRTHRCARIMFSLKYQLGEWSPQQCIDFLIDKVGHERANAEGEVRRTVAGGYGPLYQVAYMIGGLQFRALHHELVDSGKMSNRDFHDAVMAEANIPVEMVRAMLTGEAPPRDFETRWRFDELLHPAQKK
ncbi:MAG: DUF885 family protein [Phycisphaerales bacterium]|nr:DUF885 family protein [Phycisphaerales bacterium]